MVLERFIVTETFDLKKASVWRSTDHVSALLLPKLLTATLQCLYWSAQHGDLILLRNLLISKGIQVNSRSPEVWSCSPVCIPK